MNTNLIYVKTPAGDEAVRQSTRVVQRNLRMVLVQVDGKMSIGELSTKIGNPRLVEAALRELEEGGYIVPTQAAAWGDGAAAVLDDGGQEIQQPMSQFSVFGAKPATRPAYGEAPSAASNFSSFGKPILPTRGNGAASGFKPSMMPPPYQAAPELPHEAERSFRLKGRHLGGGMLTMVLLGAGALLLYPYERFKPELEAAASKYVGAPVTVGGVGLAIYPAPHLKLTGVKVGERGEGSVSEIRISSPAVLLGGASSEVSRIEVRGASLSSKQLVALPFFKSEGEKAQRVVIRKIRLENFAVTTVDSLSFSNVYGELDFRPDGNLDKARFESDDRSLLIDAQPAPLGVVLNIEGRAWKPAGASAVFASLQAKGVLQGERFLVQNIDTTFLGGVLRGSWLFDWSKGMAMAGDGTLSRIDMRQLSAAFAPSLKLEGELSGVLKLRANGRNWESLWRNAEVVLSSEISRGALHGVDLGEAARRNGTADVRGGATKFDWLRSTVTVTPKQVVSKDVRMDAGMVTASGQFVAERDGQVEGGMSVVLQSSVSRTDVPVRVYGTLPDLTAVGHK
jgi:hypothetical protein